MNEYLLIVTVMECAVSDAQIRLQIVTVRIFAIALEQRECSNKITKTQIVTRIRQLLLLLFIKRK